jgi:hypothetical protein
MLTISIEGQYGQNPKTKLSSMKNDAHSKKWEIVPYKPFTGRSSYPCKAKMERYNRIKCHIRD